MPDYDIIVIGAGINSLTTAALLGEAGKRVLVLEARHQVGGMASTVEFTPGFKCNIIYDHNQWIDPRLLKKLNLEQHSLELNHPSILRTTLNQNGEHLRFYRDPSQTAQSISHHSGKDAENWISFTEQISKLSQFLEAIYAVTPPSLPNIGLEEALSLRSLTKPIFKQGSRGLVNFMRVAPMMMPELMDEWFESEFLRGTLATAGIQRITQGPFSAATGLNFLHQHVHCKGVIHNAHFIKGGTGQLANSLQKAALVARVEIRLNTEVSAITTDNGFCKGIITNEGKSITADKVVSGLDPHSTCLRLVGAENLSPVFRTQLNNIKFRGSTARIHFALKELPSIKGIQSDNMDSIFAIAPSMEYLERAYDCAKYGRISKNPYIEFSIPSIRNPEFAPEGKQVLSASVQYVPYHLRDPVWNDELKKNVGENVITMLEKYIPGFSNLIEDSALFTPVDLEGIYGMTEGNLNHGEMTLDQFFFMRPSISAAQYQTPIKNLFLCGPGTHPSGGLHGANGVNAAVEILQG